jgi:hypothetical protein
MAFRGKLRIFASLLIPVSVYFFFFTASKTSFLCLLVELLVFGALGFRELKRRVKAMGRPKKRWALMAGALVMVLIVTGGLLVKGRIAADIQNSQTYIRVMASLKKGGLKTSFAGRADTLWATAWMMIKDHPLAGTGIGSYIIESSNYSALAKIEMGTPESAENYILEVGSELGIVGAALALGIFIALLGRIGAGRKALPPDDRWTPVFVGAAASVLGFFLNIQFHTYVQSYEIQYSFWLMAAIVTVLAAGPAKTEEPVPAESEKPGSEREKKTGWRRRPLFVKIGLTAVVLVFAASQAWNSMGALSLESRTKIFSWKQEFGLDKPETMPDGRAFRWSKGVAALAVNLAGREAVIPVHASHPDIADKPVTVRISLVRGFFRGRTALAEVELSDSRWKDVALVFPETSGSDVRLLIEVSRTWNPQKRLGVPDPRDLGVAVGEIRFLPSSL